jgi:hypothetical protein
MHIVGGRQATPWASSPQQSRLPGGQQRNRPPGSRVATVPGGQQPVVPMARAFGQHVRLMARAEGNRAAAPVVVTQTSPDVQQS